MFKRVTPKRHYINVFFSSSYRIMSVQNAMDEALDSTLKMTGIMDEFSNRDLEEKTIPKMKPFVQPYRRKNFNAITFKKPVKQTKLKTTLV